MKTLLIEVTEADVALLQTSLDAYETQSTQTAVTVSMMSVLFAKKGETGEEEFIRENDERMKKAADEGRDRKMKSMRLRLKLMEATERTTEFSV